MKAVLIRFFRGYKGWVFVFAVCAGIALHLYTQRIVNELRAEARSLVLFYAQMYARVAETDSSDDITFIFDQIIMRTNFPLIQTDLKKNPIGWKGIRVDPDDRSSAAMKE